MRLLAFDTCLAACSAAVCDATGRVMARRHEPMQRGHAERLLPMINSVMREAGVGFADLDALAVTIGPGTFTGVRVGVAVARALALATGLPVYATTSLALLAATARMTLPEADRSLPMAAAVDARKGEIYCEIVESGTEASSVPAMLIRLDAMAARLGSCRVLAIGTAAAALSEAAGASAAEIRVVGDTAEPDAAAMPTIALARLDPVAPLYLRPPDASPPQKLPLTRA